MATFDLRLDTDKQAIVPQQITARQGDSESCVVVAEVTENGAPYSFAGKTVRFECTKPDGSVVRDPGVTVSGSTLTYNVPREVIEAPGTIRAAFFRIIQGVAFLDSTESFIIFVDKGISAGGPSSGDYLADVDASLAALKQQSSAAAEAESQRVANEQSRASAEGARASAEQGRAAAESARRSAEQARLSAEDARALAEDARIESEIEREAAEEDRALAELSREEAEAYRSATFAEIEQRSKGWLRHWCNEGDYDPVTRRPTVPDPNTATMYFVPEEHGDEGSVWVEWVWDDAGQRWEKLGSVEASIAPITVDQLDAIVAGTDTDEGGSEVLTRWGLRYWFAKLRGVFASLVHTHSASDIASGTFGTARIADNAVTSAKLSQELRDSLSQTSMSPDVVQFNLTNDRRIRFALYDAPSDGSTGPYLAVNVMSKGQWQTMKRLVVW